MLLFILCIPQSTPFLFQFCIIRCDFIQSYTFWWNIPVHFNLRNFQNLFISHYTVLKAKKPSYMYMVHVFIQIPDIQLVSLGKYLRESFLIRESPTQTNVICQMTDYAVCMHVLLLSSIPGKMRKNCVNEHYHPLLSCGMYLSVVQVYC